MCGGIRHVAVVVCKYRVDFEACLSRQFVRREGIFEVQIYLRICQGDACVFLAQNVGEVVEAYRIDVYSVDVVVCSAREGCYINICEAAFSVKINFNVSSTKIK